MTKSGNPLLDLHFREVGTYALPSKTQELELFTSYRLARSRAELSPSFVTRESATKEYQDIAKEIACGYLRFVIRQARRKSHEDWVFADLISAGYEGLMHAITLFEPERGNRFLTYANNWINVRMQEYLYKVRVVHVPSHTRKEMRRSQVENEKRRASGEAIQPLEEPVISSIDNVVVVDTGEGSDVEREAMERGVDALGLLSQAALSRVERQLAAKEAYLAAKAEMGNDQRSRILEECRALMREAITDAAATSVGELKNGGASAGTGGPPK
jgi:RNA polymerase sigma factor (sigma-70 family)